MLALLKRLAYLLRDQPTTVAVTVQAITALVVSHYHFTPGQAGAIEAATAAVLGVVAATFTHPFRVQAVSGLVTAATTLAVAFGWHFSTETVSVINAVATALILLVRGQKTITLAEYRARRAAETRHAGPAD